MNGSVVACSSSYISTCRARYIRFSLPGAYLLTSPYVEWRRPPQLVYTADYTTYVQVLTWFFGSPSTLCPFSVHNRMALAGKEIGKNVGQWFGPSTVAGAIKCVDTTTFAVCMLTFLSNPWCKVSLKHRLASRSPSTARSSRRMCIWHYIHPPNLLVPANYRDGAIARSSCSSVFGLEQTESTRSITM